MLSGHVFCSALPGGPDMRCWGLMHALQSHVACSVQSTSTAAGRAAGGKPKLLTMPRVRACMHSLPGPTLPVLSESSCKHNACVRMRALTVLMCWPAQSEAGLCTCAV